MALHHWFIPHQDTHQKAHLISWHALLIYILLFILLKVSFSIIGYAQPGILGISSNIDQKKLIELTNQERAKKGRPPLIENEVLDKAAQMKAQNMFEENYWAHFAPSGKSPWDFILGAGYKFTYAGENLAKNFYQSDDVVAAWIASATHRENLLNSKYQDIGIAVVEGVLNGEKTTLIVQIFGNTQNITPQPVMNISGQQVAVPPKEYAQTPQLVASVQNPITIKPILDPYQALKAGAVSVIFLIAILLLIDVWVLTRRGVFRLTSHHFAHMALFGVTAASLLITSPGSIL